MLKVVKSSQSKRDVTRIYAYLFREAGEETAERFVNVTVKAFAGLASMPGMGVQRDYGNPRLIGMRSWSISGFSNYLIFYRTTETSLDIVRVVHGARNLTAIFGN